MLNHLCVFTLRYGVKHTLSSAAEMALLKLVLYTALCLSDSEQASCRKVNRAYHDKDINSHCQLPNAITVSKGRLEHSRAGWWLL